MKSILTLDYELYFGKDSGTALGTIIKPIKRLLSVLDKYSAKAVFFVDANYLVRLRELAQDSVRLEDDYIIISNNIKELEAAGHQIQLHIHPHWHDSIYEDGRWLIKTDRYRLADWSVSDAAVIVNRAVCELNSHLNKKVNVFRAGGWCIQPFKHMRDALKENGVLIDSTVFVGGRSKSSSHNFDFTRAPAQSAWRFEDDPCQAQSNGEFLEIPISSMSLSPSFFWKLALNKFSSTAPEHQPLGVGSAIKNGKRDIFRMLTSNSRSVVSVDGYKSSLLVDEYKSHLQAGACHFVVIGHPKALTEFSLRNIDSWLSCLVSDGRSLELY